PEARRVKELLQTETIGGVLLLMAAVAALTWANSPWSHSYEVLRDAHIGPHFLGLNMSVAHWAADGLLALFFFVVGLELKHEFVVGDLKNPSAAAVPVIAAVCGVAVPALIYAAINAGGDGAQGWAIPTATDIAFALAVLAVIGSHLPTALRSFLLT
ncbi:Na+/H+ antiporter NhaA, partial [Klebsiella pneumoniae]|uniref:Na+/H+ antiporter NhaA n=2 Tax=Bacteria TaxID=2 RepID=UPI003FA5B632